MTKLRLDGGTQPRVRIDMDVVRDYAERIKAGDDFPPVDVFHDGAEHWLAEGFHRYHAYKEAGHKVVPCTIRKGTVRDAVLFSCGANGSHGLRRTNADKRRAVETLLKDDEWGKKSDKWVAEQAAVSDMLVRDVRRQVQDSCTSKCDSKRTGKDGKSYPVAKHGKESKHQKQETTITVIDDFDDDLVDDPVESAHPAKPSAQPEPNEIGGLLKDVDAFMQQCAAFRKPHVRMAIADHLAEVWIPKLRS